MISQNSLDKVCKARAVSSDGEITAGDLLEQIIELNKEHAASELEWEKRYVKRGEVLTKLEEALKEAHNELDEAMKYQIGLKKELTNLQTSLATEKNAVSHLAHSTTGLLKRAETVEAELAASRADAYERAAEHIPIDRGGEPDDPAWLISRGACSCGQLVADGVTLWNKLWGDHIRALITPTDAAARAERDRRIRLEEQERCLKPLWSLGCEIKKIGISLDQRETADEFLTIIESLRAPVPAERAGDAVCPTCKGVDAIWMRTGDFTKRVLGPCPDCHGTGRAKLEENNATD